MHSPIHSRLVVLAGLCLLPCLSVGVHAQDAAPASKTVEATIAIDASKIGEPISPVHLRSVHRAPGPLHLRRHLGGDARRPQVLLSRSCRR